VRRRLPPPGKQLKIEVEYTNGEKTLASICYQIRTSSIDSRWRFQYFVGSIYSIGMSSYVDSNSRRARCLDEGDMANRHSTSGP
jgi:hypothetical protein